MEELIKLLKEMGATDVSYDCKGNDDECLTFKFQNKKAYIHGVHLNNSTGGLDAGVDIES